MRNTQDASGTVNSAFVNSHQLKPAGETLLIMYTKFKLQVEIYIIMKTKKIKSPFRHIQNISLPVPVLVLRCYGGGETSS